MKNKKVTYLLIVVTVVVWGTIGWKVYNALKKDNVPITVKNERGVSPKESDSIQLILDYRDPFLGDYDGPKRAAATNTQAAAVTNRQPVQTEPEVLPDFRYMGVIRIGTETKAMVNINGETILLAVNEYAGEFVLLNISDEKLVVKRNRKEYTLPLR